MRINVFLCYSDRNTEIALQITEYFQKCLGFNVFMARINLRFSDDWLNDIWINLEKSDILIPLLSKDLESSSFANQEIGVALAKNKKIIPLSLDGSMPKGFISKNQAHKYDKLGKEEILDFVTQTYFNIFNDRKLKAVIPLAMNSVVHAFCNSDSFERTSIMLKLIKKTHELRKFSKEHISKIVIASKDNPMISKTDYLFPMLKEFLLNSYKIVIDK